MTQWLFLIVWKKNSISNLHVIGMPLNEQTISFFFLPCSFISTDLSVSRGNQKNPRTENYVFIYIYIFAKFSFCQRNPLMKNIKTKKKYLYHLCNFNSSLLDKPSPWAWPRVKYCLRCSFWLLAVSRHFPPSSVCPGFCQFRNILMCCAILLQYVAFKASIKHK